MMESLRKEKKWGRCCYADFQRLRQGGKKKAKEDGPLKEDEGTPVKKCTRGFEKRGLYQSD